MKVPFVDLTQQYACLQTELDHGIASVIKDAAFVRGKYVKAFEDAYRDSYGVKHCIPCANGTDAIYIVLKMLGIGPGDEVITTACSWIATSETITQAGATPVFVDIDPDTYNINTSLIEQKVTEKTKAIIPVHLYGQPVDMDPIVEIAQKHNLIVVEDCAQAHYAEYKGQKVGTLGIAGTFSFYPGKNLGAYGDAGCIVTNDDDLAAACRMYANHGSSPADKHEHEIEGINSRMDGIQAAVLSVKLPHIHEWCRRRYENAARYSELLNDIPEVVTPIIPANSTHVFHVYCIRAERRDELQDYLRSKGIATVRHYPKALPFLNAYVYLGHQAEDFPVAYAYQNQILSLPMFPELEIEQMTFIVASIKRFYDSIDDS